MIGNYLKAARLDAALGMRQLSRLSGVDQSTISLIESGKTPNPGFLTVCRLLGTIEIYKETQHGS